MTGIVILIGKLRCFKGQSLWKLYLFSVYFKIGFHNLSNICCWYTLESHRGNSNVGWLVGFVALRPKSTAMVIAGRSVHLTTLFPGQA